jgi:hypothetical protein
MEYLCVFEKLKYRFLIGKYRFDLKKVSQVQLPIFNHTAEILDVVSEKCANKPNNFANINVLENNNTPTKNIVKRSDESKTQINSLVSYEEQHIIQKPGVITSGFLSKLTGRTQIEWEPFVCKVEKRIFNKINNRWYLIVNDSEKSHRVVMATQCFKLFEKDIVKKDDLIYVEYYTATKLASNKPKLVMFTKIYKIEQSDDFVKSLSEVPNVVKSLGEIPVSA